MLNNLLSASDNTQLLSISHFIQIISILISILAIFISNYLGRKSEKQKYIFELKKKRYYSFYFPIIKKFIEVTPDYHDYFHMVVAMRFAVINYSDNLEKISPNNSYSKEDWLQQHILNNMEYISKNISNLYADYDLCSVNVMSFLALNVSGEFNQKYLDDYIKADSLFNEIILLALEESKELTKELQLPDLAENILNTFLVRKECKDPNRKELLLKQLQDLQGPVELNNSHIH